MFFDFKHVSSDPFCDMQATNLNVNLGLVERLAWGCLLAGFCCPVGLRVRCWREVSFSVARFRSCGSSYMHAPLIRSHFGTRAKQPHRRRA
jgi:hypothetical protein